MSYNKLTIHVFGKEHSYLQLIVLNGFVCGLKQVVFFSKNNRNWFGLFRTRELLLLRSRPSKTFLSMLSWLATIPVHSSW